MLFQKPTRRVVSSVSPLGPVNEILREREMSFKMAEWVQEKIESGKSYTSLVSLVIRCCFIGTCSWSLQTRRFARTPRQKGTSGGNTAYRLVVCPAIANGLSMFGLRARGEEIKKGKSVF